MSREKHYLTGPPSFLPAEAHGRRLMASDCSVPAFETRMPTLFAREPGDLRSGPDSGKRGPHREGEKP